MLWCGVWVGGGVGCSVTLRLQLYRVFSNLSSTKISIARCAGVVGCAVPADCPARCQPVGQAVGVSCGWSVVGRGGLSGCRGVRFLCALLHLHHIGAWIWFFQPARPQAGWKSLPLPHTHQNSTSTLSSPHPSSQIHYKIRLPKSDLRYPSAFVFTIKIF